MADSDRQFSWRQGDVLTVDAVQDLKITLPDSGGDCFAIVISHDCDLTASADKEPVAEVVIGRRIAKLGGDSYGKTARRLHIEYETNQGVIALELTATTKMAVDKLDLFKTDPRPDMHLDGAGIRVLQRWLASRYYRAAFPEAFENRLRAAVIPGKKTFLKKIEALLEDGGQHIRALLFDLDEGVDVERRDPSDVYQLGITVLYDSLKDEPAAAKVAEKAAEDLGKR